MTYDEWLNDGKALRPSGHLEIGWCQQKFAVNAAGEKVAMGSPSAVAWCLLGSLGAAWEGGHITYKEHNELDALLHARHGDLDNYNDRPERTQAEVVTAMKDAERVVFGEGC